MHHAMLGRGTGVDTKCHKLSYSFQLSLFLFMHWPGYCSLSPGLYSLHTDVLVCTLLLNWCLHGGTRPGVSLSTILVMFPRLLFLKAGCYFTPIWTGCSLGLLVSVILGLLFIILLMFPGSCASLFFLLFPHSFDEYLQITY